MRILNVERGNIQQPFGDAIAAGALEIFARHNH
jgi:hypothetical protein